MENGSTSVDGSFQDICEDETVMDGRVQVSFTVYMLYLFKTKRKCNRRI